MGLEHFLRKIPGQQYVNRDISDEVVSKEGGKELPAIATNDGFDTTFAENIFCFTQNTRG